MSRRRTLIVTIDGIQTPVLDVHTTHDVDKPIGVGSIVTRAPRRAHMRLGAPVVIQAGYDGYAPVIFMGRIADDEAAFSESGGELRIELEGHGKRLWYKRRSDMVIPGAQTLQRIFNTLCHASGVPRYWSDVTTTPAGTPVVFGGVAEVDNGGTIVPKDKSPGEVLDRLARLYGYRTFDRNDGYHRQQKISGLPVGSVSASYQEGVNVLSVSQGRTLDGMANDIEVLGAQYTAADTSEVAVRSIAAEVPFDERLGPSGVNSLTIRDPAILTNARADQVRNVYEIDRSTPQYRWTWTATGDPLRMPGQVVSVTSPSVGSNTRLWLMRVTHDITDRGWTTTMEGWAGAGRALPAGDDCVVRPLVNNQGFHIGNEYLSHYRNPHPSGLEKSIPFTVEDDYSTLTIRGFAHGANSFQGNQQSTASRFEIWQPHEPDRAVASGEFPRQDENLERRLDYREDGNWEPITIPLTGSLKAGAATLKIISGYDSDVGDNDDFEVRDVTLTTCGVGTPVIIV